MLDYWTLDLQKNLYNHSVVFVEQTFFTLVKAPFDSIITSDSPSFAASKPVTDITSLTDAATLFPRIGKSDSTSMTDDLVVEQLVSSALLNFGLLGNAIFNAD